MLTMFHVSSNYWLNIQFLTAKTLPKGQEWGPWVSFHGFSCQNVSFC